MLVDHLIRFQRCDCHSRVTDESALSMSEFIKQRKKLLASISQFNCPDFALLERLPVNARLPDDDDSEGLEDEGERLASTPLLHMSNGKWNECYKTVQEVFTGRNDSDGEEEERIHSNAIFRWIKKTFCLPIPNKRGLMREEN